MEWSERESRYLEYLRDEGYRPRIDDDGDIHVKCEGFNYYVIATDDEQYLQLLLPGIWAIDSQPELEHCLRAASEVNRRIKVVKVAAHRGMTDMFVAAEIYITHPDAFTALFPRLIATMRTARERFREEMSKQTTISTTGTPTDLDG